MTSYLPAFRREFFYAFLTFRAYHMPCISHSRY